MVSLVMLAIMAGCAIYLFLKGTLAQGIAMIFNALIAGFFAFGFYELVTGYLIKYSPGLAAWAPMIAFLLLFVLVFAALQAAAMQISKEKIDFGKLPEQIGRVVAGLVLGYIVTGHVLIAAAMAPLPVQYPYPRFDERNPNPSNPKKPLLSPDGFVAGLFGTISKGGFGAIGEPQSFALLRAGFVDQLYLNRYGGKDVPRMTATQAVDSPRKNGVWEAPDNLRDAENRPVSSQAGKNLMLVRAEIRKSAMKDASKFTLSQFRLICRPKTGEATVLAGAGEAAYPVGYIGAGGRLETKSLSEVISIDAAKVPGDSVTMDLAFQVPTDMAPMLLEFKRNNVVQVSSPASAEDAPPPVPFGSAPQPRQAAPQAEPAEGQPAEPERGPRGQGRRGGRGLSGLSQGIAGTDVNEN